LRDKGIEPRSFQELLGKRYEEYAHYQKWLPEKGEGSKGTLFWEFAKKVATILCVGQSIIFQTFLTKLLLGKIVGWNLDKLLPEQEG
jgi:hypothetical protein